MDATEAGIKNAYLQALSSETNDVICGAEFGLENIGKVAIICHALYGGKSSGAEFWKHLRSCMTNIGFNSYKADTNIWMREAQKYDGTPFWEHVLVYVDDALVISNRGEDVIRKDIRKYFYVKDCSIGRLSIYLGKKVSKVTFENGVEA